MVYIITGGGTGGHIYPALAIAQEIRETTPEATIVLVGARRGLEKKIFSQTEFKSFFIPVGQFHSSVGKWKQFKTLFMLPFCFLMALWILVRFRPKAVLGVGGYASVPVCVLSAFLGFRTYVWEANAVPGLANKIIGKFKAVPLLVFKEAQSFFKNKQARIVGLPIRKELDHHSDELSQPNPSKPFTLLFVGGSQGAALFNRLVPELVLDHVKIIHQTGLKNYDQTLEKYSKDSQTEVLAYLDPIKEFYQRADLIVCRAGASTLVELSQMGKACLLIPFPKSSDDHQVKNAQSLVQRGAALMLREEDVTLDKLKSTLEDLISDAATMSKMKAAFLGAFPGGARKKIADILLS